MAGRLLTFFRTIKEGKIFFKGKQAVSLSLRHLFQDFQINKRLHQIVCRFMAYIQQTLHISNCDDRSTVQINQKFSAVLGPPA